MKSATVEINPEQLLGKVLTACVRKETLKLKCKVNDKEGNNARPDYKSWDGLSIWINEEEGDNPF